MILSVIVSAYSLNRLNNLIQLIDGISDQSYKSFESIIVIDKNKELFNKIREYISSNRLKNINTIFNPENKGLSYSRNVGVKK